MPCCMKTMTCHLEDVPKDNEAKYGFEEISRTCLRYLQIEGSLAHKALESSQLIALEGLLGWAEHHRCHLHGLCAAQLQEGDT